MKRESPVSLVIPCYNQACYLGQAIESAVGQDAGRPEIIVVDDGSTDDVAGVVRRYPMVRFLPQENLGVAVARNRGFALASRPHVVFLDADDRLRPNALSDGLLALGDRPDAACAIGLCCIIGPDGGPQPYRQQPPVEGDPYEALLRENFVWMPAQVLYRREALGRSGGFDPSIPAAADYDLYLRVARQFPVALHRAIVAEYRMHGQNMSGNPMLMLRSTLTVLERQWTHARQRPEHRAAYAAGNRFWRDFYGDRIVEQIRDLLRVEGWGRRVAFTAMMLFRYHPRAVFLHLSRKVRNKVMSSRTGASGTTSGGAGRSEPASPRDPPPRRLPGAPGP